MTATPLALLVFGFFLGVRHATDADHVVAVTTIACRGRSARAAMALGALWGLGHTATIVIVGGAIVVFGAVIPPRLGLSLEMAVAGMLILLGLLNLSGRAQGSNLEANDPRLGPPTRRPGNPWRPLLIGVVHGLAGSAAVALLVLATIRTPGWAVVYLMVFGAGTVMGMMLLTTAMTMPLAAVARRFGALESVMARLTGVLSLVFGLVLVYRLGFVDGLFTSAPHWTPR